MNEETIVGERPVELVRDLIEGRLTYLADMADELSRLAVAGREAQLANLFAVAATLARDAVEKRMKDVEDKITE